MSYCRPFFSVVIPTYNCCNLLHRALLSVQNQTYSDFEVIVIDNSSTDNTQEMLQQFSCLTMTVLNIANGGIIAASRNMGIKAARGRWIAFLDSDDVWYPTKLEAVEKIISADTDSILVCHNERVISAGCPGTILQYGPEEPEMYRRLLFRGNALSTSAVTVKREVLLDTGGFSERVDFVTVEDYEYWLRLSQAGKFRFLPQVLGEFHIHGGNASGRAEKHSEALIAVVSHHLKSFSNGLVSDDLVRKRFAAVWSEAARILQKSGLFGKARQRSRVSLSYWPWAIRPYVVYVLSLLHLRW